MNGTLPWMKDDGTWDETKSCPWPGLQEAVTMLKHFENWKAGHSPVNLGWSTSVPRSFVDAMDVIRSEINLQESARARRERG